MSPAEEIRKLFAGSDIQVNSKIDDRIIDNALTALDKSEKAQSVWAESKILRLIMKSRITKLGTTAVIIIVVLGFLLFFGSNQPTLYAEIARGLESARTMHYVVRIYRDEEWRTYYEVWFDHEKGVVEIGHPSNRYHRRIDDGAYVWRYTPGGDFVVRSKSIGPQLRVEHFIYGEWSQGKTVRKPDGDKVVDGVQCQMYYSVNPANTKEAHFWVEDDKGKKFLRLWESRCRDESGQWKSSKAGSIQYDVPIVESSFSTDFGPNMRIIDADKILEERLGLDNAIVTREVMGLIFAVHRLQRGKDGLIYLSCSVRPTGETIKRFGAITLANRDKVYGNLELFSISNGKICFPYKKYRLSKMRYNGIDAKSWILVPRRTWPKASNKLELGVLVITRGELQRQRAKEGKPKQREFKPMVTLVLPDEEASVDAMIAYAYSEAKVFNRIKEVHLYVSGAESHLPVWKLFENVSEMEFTQSVNQSLKQLKNHEQ